MYRFVRENGVPERQKLSGSLAAGNRYFDFAKLHEVTCVATRNLNKIIDVNYYPAESARRSNLRHRPIGLGVQVRPFGSKQLGFLIVYQTPHHV